jgi:biopolymer transport protein ExbD
MTMDIGAGGKGVKGDINVTPLIDVVLVLLIIFMVLTPSMLKHLTAAVPKKADETVPTPPSDAPIIVEYTAGRTVTLDTEPVAVEALAAKLAERLRFDARKVVFFRADDDAPYGEVIRLMDIARGAGARTLAAITKR